MTELLLQNGANIMFWTGLTTVLHSEIEWRNLEMLPILVRNIDYKKVRDKFGETPLELSMTRKDIEITKLIVFNTV